MFETPTLSAPPFLPDGLPWDTVTVFADLFEHAALGMAVVGLDKRFLRVNASLCRMLGRSEADLRTMTTTDVTHPDDRSRDLVALPEHLVGARRTYQVEKRYVHCDGRSVWVLIGSTMMTDADGHPLYLVGQVKDITDRKEAEAALAARNADLQAVLDAFPDLHFWLDPDGTIRRYHAGSKTYVPPEAFLNRRMQDVMPPQVGQVIADAMLCARATGTAVQVDYPLTMPEGTRWYDARLVPTDGGQILVAVRDITDRKISEGLLARHSEELLQANATLGQRVAERTTDLRHSLAEAERLRKQMEEILERISDAFVALDRDWRYTYVNEKAAAAFGRRREDLIGKHIWTEFPEGVGQTFHRAYERAVAEQRPIEIEEYYPPYDRWFSNRIYPSPDGLSIAFYDITDRKKVEQARRALQRRLASAQEDERRRLARDLHDHFGQLMVGCQLKMEALRQVVAANPTAVDLLQQLGAAAEQVGRAAHQIAWDLRPATLDDLGLTRALDGYLRDWSAGSGVAADFQEVGPVGDLPPDVATTVFRVVQEALTNVAKHAAARRASVVLVYKDGELVTVVEDDGCGFDPLAPTTSGDDGGLGLLGMRERAALVGGGLDIESAPGRGTTLFLRIPLAPRPSRETPCPSSASS